MNYQFYNVREKGGVGVVELNRPPVNAFTLDMVKELGKVIEDISFNESIRAVVITGNKKFFSTGADIELMNKGGWVYLKELVKAGQRVFEKIETLPYIVVAAIDGYCLGGGFELALACDRRVMSEEGASVGLPEVKLGLIPAWGSSYRLPRLLGKPKALDLMITGAVLNGKEAKELGVVDETCPKGEVVSNAMEYASALASGATVAIGKIKKCIHDGAELSFGRAMRLELSSQEVVFGTDDFKEGTQSFMEKRTPKFRGS